MNESLEQYYGTETFRLNFSKQLIEQQNSGSLEKDSIIFELSTKPEYTLVKDAEDAIADQELMLFSQFEQLDGIKVSVEREVKDGLTIVKEATFASPTGEVIFRLSEVIPDGYLVIEEARIGRDSIHPGNKIILLARGFLENTGGRLTFIHEVGHGHDYTNSPMGREEFFDAIKGIDDRQREESAWENARKFLKMFKEKGVQWFADDFDDKKFDEAVSACVQAHHYP